MLLLLGFLGVCTGIDFEEERIPNWICLLGAVIGLIFGWNREGIEGMKKRLFSVSLLFIILLPFWIWNVAGGGDMKLLLLTACYLGIRVWRMLLFSLFFTGIYGGYLLFNRKNFRQRMEIFYSYCREAVQTGSWKVYPFDRKQDQKTGGIHLSYGILLGYMGYLVTEYIPVQHWI